MRPAAGKRRWQLILPSLYLLLAAYVWFDFTGINHDGLANVGLMLVTLPVMLIGLAIGAVVGSKSFILLPTSYGYLTDHAIYYVPAVAITALLIWWLGRAIDRRRARSTRPPADHSATGVAPE